MIKKILPGVVALALAGTASAQDVSMFLNKANQMNYEEVETAKIAKDKAGDNQALATYAHTIKGDHSANEDAVSALSRQKSVKLEGTDPKKAETNKLNSLNGGAFNEAYLDEQVNGHKDAVRTFETAQRQFKGNRDMELYIQQTLPVLKAHLAMAENLRHSLSTTSPENPENNKHASR